MRQRVQKLLDQGVMQIVAVTDPLTVGFRRQAMVGINVEGDLDPVADALTAMAEVRVRGDDRGLLRPHGGDRLRGRRPPAGSRSTSGSARCPACAPPRASSTSSSRSRPTCGEPDSREHRTSPRPRTTTCGCTSPACRRTRTRPFPPSCAARAPTSTTTRASATSTVSRACSWSTPVTAARSWPRPRTSRPRSSRSSPCGRTPTPRPSSSPSVSPTTRPGDLNKVFFTTGGGEAVETAWKLAKQYFKLHGQAHQVQGHLACGRLPRHPAGRPVHHRPAGPEGPLRAAGPRRAQGAEHQHLPRPDPRRRPRGLRPLGRRPDRAGDPLRGRRTPSPPSSWSRCRTPAAASRRRPATSSGSARSATSTTCCSSPTRSSAPSAASARCSPATSSTTSRT